MIPEEIANGWESPAASRSTITLAQTTELKPTMNPTDRSIPPVIITKVSPVANRRTVVDARRIFWRLFRLK